MLYSQMQESFAGMDCIPAKVASLSGSPYSKKQIVEQDQLPWQAPTTHRSRVHSARKSASLNHSCLS